MCKEFSRTRFLTIPVGISPDRGTPIGEGKCSAVRLRINAYNRNTSNPTGVAAVVLAYYGDAQSQENELTAGVDIAAGRTQFKQNDWTPKIYCENLEEVFVRQPAIPNNVLNIQVMIYLSDEDFKS